MSGCRQAILAIFNAFWTFIATYLNPHLLNFAKYHCIFEFNRRQTVFFEIKCLERYQWCHAMWMVVSFLGAQFQSKHLRENEKKLSCWKMFNLTFLFWEFFLNGQSPYDLKRVTIAFYLQHIFQYIPLKNVINYFCFKKKVVSAFY